MQRNENSAELKRAEKSSLLISASVMTPALVETEITLPHFCKKNDQVFKVFSKDHVIRIYTTSTRTNIGVAKLEHYDGDVATGEMITEVDFMMALDSAIAQIKNPLP